MSNITSVDISRQTRARISLITLLAAMTFCANPSNAADKAVKAAGETPKGCDLAKKQLLFMDDQCDIPIESRYGDDTREKDKKVTLNPYKIFVCEDFVKKVTGTEKKRKSRIESDFDTILGSLKEANTAALVKPTCKVKPWSQQLLFKRSTLEIKALNEAGEELQAKTVITGPKEHWFLGLDLPVTSQKTLKYDSETQTLQPKDKDVQLYLSLNYLLGDVLVDMDEGGKPTGWNNFVDNLSIKLFVRASSRPFDSAGVGLGYRVPKIDLGFGDLGLSGLSIYGGYFWTKEDAIKNGSPDPNGSRDGQWRVGVTFDVESMIKAVKW